MKSDQINELASALAKAQSEIKGAVKDANNPFFKSKYADLESVWEACRGPLAKNNLAIVQASQIGEFGAVLVTTLMHSSGQWIEGVYPVDPVKKDPQGLGAATTYARRYALAAMVGVCSIEDDDGESAMNRKPVDRPAPAAQPVPPQQRAQPPAPSKPLTQRPQENRQQWRPATTDNSVPAARLGQPERR